jgi:hypothetical protein
MTYHEILDVVRAAKGEDWLVNDSKGIFTLKTDLDVTLREVRTHEPEPFAEDWAQDFPNPAATRAIFELWFRASFVMAYDFVAVDGGRALLPLPKAADDLTITRVQFAIADAVNFSGNRSCFEEYIQRFRVAR